MSIKRGPVDGYVCPLCEITYKRFSWLKRHMIKNHPRFPIQTTLDGSEGFEY